MQTIAHGKNYLNAEIYILISWRETARKESLICSLSWAWADHLNIHMYLSYFLLTWMYSFKSVVSYSWPMIEIFFHIKDNKML